MRDYVQKAIWCALLLTIAKPLYIRAQTRQYLEAQTVESQLKVRWNNPTKSMQWAADSDTYYRGIDQDSLFLSKKSIYITYSLLNPLKTQASASAIAVDDPAYSTITKLIESLTGVITLVSPKPAEKAMPFVANKAQGECGDPASDIASLRGLLYGDATSPTTIGDEVSSWSKEIDDAFVKGESGPQAIQAGIKAIEASADKINKNISNANDGWKHIENCAVNAPVEQKAIYQAAALSNPERRIQELIAISGAMKKLSEQLSKDYLSEWVGANKTDFVISPEIKPTFAKMQSITVKVTTLSYKVDSNSGIFSTDQQSEGSSTFNVRKYSLLTPEIGVGAVFGTLTQPTYGTGTNSAGQTVVAKKDDKSISVNPTILANFVCRCEAGLLAPMLQIGAATSKDLPAILLGAGIRLFGLGKGDIAVGGGAMFGWYQDLQKLKVGDVIGGTNDINNDLGYISAPKIGGYFAVQYKF